MVAGVGYPANLFGRDHFHDSTCPSANERLQPWLCRSAGRESQSSIPWTPTKLNSQNPSSIDFSCSSMKTNSFDGEGSLIREICEEVNFIRDAQSGAGLEQPK